MLMRLAIALLTAVIVSGCTTPVEGPVVNGYLCCSLRTDGASMSDYNDDSRGTRLLQPGTPARITAYTNRSFTVDVDGTPQKFRNDYSRDIRPLPFAHRYVVTQDPKPRIAAFPPAYRNAIAAGKVALGMTREQVLMALAYPITSDTAALDATTWHYWRNANSAYQVNFDAQGRVESVSGHPIAVSRALSAATAEASATP